MADNSLTYAEDAATPPITRFDSTPDWSAQGALEEITTLTGLIDSFSDDITAAQGDITTIQTQTSTNDLGIVSHGGTAGTARPTGFAKILWVGTVTPTNAVTGDVYINSTTDAVEVI